MPRPPRDHTVFLLGAGFSAPGGIPVMASFLQNILAHRDDPRVELGEDLEKRYSRVLEARRRMRRSRDMMAMDLDNIETLFGLIDMEDLLGEQEDGVRTSSDDIKHVLAHTVERTYDRHRRNVRLRFDRASVPSLWGSHWIEGLEAQQKPADEKQPRRPDAPVFLDMPFYDYAVASMVGLLEPRSRANYTAAIISFNYDTVVEQSLTSVGIDWDYGVHLAPYKGKRARARAADRIPLVKLHGSANWAYTGKRGTRAHIHDAYSDFAEKTTPILVPPTWRKGDVSDLVRESWSVAVRELRRATRIVVIGYAAPETDAHFQHLMATALASSDGLYTLTIVDLEQGWTAATLAPASPVIARFSELFAPLRGYGRLQYFGGGVERFFLNPSGGPPPSAAFASLGASLTYADSIMRESIQFGASS